MTSTTQSRSERIAAIGRALSELDAELRSIQTPGAEEVERSQLAFVRQHLSSSLREFERAKGGGTKAPAISQAANPASESANVLSLLKFMESVPAIVFFKDANRRYIAVNKHYEAQLGRTASDVVGKIDSEIFPPELASTYARSDEAVLKSGEALQFEEHLAVGSEKQFFLVSKFPIRDGSGKIVAIAGMATDITARKRGESALLASTLHPDDSWQRVQFGSWEVDFKQASGAQKGTLRWSDEIYRIAGLEPNSVPPTSELFYQLVHSDDRDAVRNAVAEATRNHTDYSIVHRLVRPSGEVRIVHETAHLFFDDGGQLARMIGTIHDITEQREAEQRFRQLAENIQEVFWLTTADKEHLLYVSPSYETVWGRSPAELYANPSSWLDCILDSDRGRAKLAIARQKDGSTSEEYRIVRPDGTARWIFDRAFPIRDASGEVYRIAGVALDITERKETEIALARSNRSLQLLTSCHESLIRATDEKQLIQEICELAVSMGGYRMAWVGYASTVPGQWIEPMAWAGEDSGYLSEIKLSWSHDDPTGHGPAAEAVRTGKAAVCEDLNSGGFYWKNAAASRGYRHVICLPLRDEAGSFGVLALYSAEVQRVAPGELKLLQDLADDLAFGIANVRSRVERQRAQSMVLKLAESVSTKAGSEFFLTLTQNMVEALGAKGGAIGKVRPTDRKMVDTISFYVGGKFLDNVTYSVEGTPCQDVIRGAPSIHECKIQERFPEDVMLQDLGLHAYAGIPLFTPQGEVTGLMAVFFDRPIDAGELVLSTLKIFASRAGAEIQRLEAGARIREQASLLDKARDAILVRDLDHRITYWNKSAERMYGWSADEVIGRQISTLIYRDSAPFFAAMASLQEDGEWNGELTQVTKAGETITVECRWTLVHDEKGKPKGVLAINTDVTERKLLEAQFLRAQRMESIGTLAGGIAHDLNNVLAPILMSIELLRGPMERIHQDAILDTLQASAQRGADLVRQVLSFARGVDGKRVSVDPRKVADEVEKMLRDTLPKNVFATIEKQAGVWPIHGDPTQLHQVLVNLCVNARDAMPHGGKLTVSLSNAILTESVAAKFGRDAKAGRYTKIAVADTGAGMAPEVLDKIFEPFFTTKEFGSGTGLGLSTTLAIVRSHGGFIHVESTPGRGSVFQIYIPARADAPSTAGSDGQKPALPCGHGELILVIDDEDSLRVLAKRVLENFGYRVALARNGLEALEYFRENAAQVAAVLTDMAMPGMDGPTVIGALREIRPDIRIIGSSGLSTQAGIAAATGVQLRFLVKPYTTSALLDAVRETLA